MLTEITDILKHQKQQPIQLQILPQQVNIMFTLKLAYIQLIYSCECIPPNHHSSFQAQHLHHNHLPSLLHNLHISNCIDRHQSSHNSHTSSSHNPLSSRYTYANTNKQQSQQFLTHLPVPQAQAPVQQQQLLTQPLVQLCKHQLMHT